MHGASDQAGRSYCPCTCMHTRSLTFRALAPSSLLFLHYACLLFIVCFFAPPHQKEFLVCMNILGNKQDSDSEQTLLSRATHSLTHSLHFKSVLKSL